MNLVIDQGNSLTKLYLFRADDLVEKKQFSNSAVGGVMEIIKKNGQLDGSIYSSVGAFESELEWLLTANSKKYIQLNYLTPIPVSVQYLTPQTLGADRLAAVVGANFIFEGKNVVVFDIGTAMTIDFVTAKAIYLGGNISPGPRTRFKSLNQHTARLPLVEPSEEFEFIGNSTNSAILNGVMNSVLYEIENYCIQFAQQYSNPIAVITGGDSVLFVNKIKNPIFAEPNLVAIGLNRILNYNVSKHLSKPVDF